MYRVEKNHGLKKNFFIQMFKLVNSFKHVLFKSIWVLVLTEGT